MRRASLSTQPPTRCAPLRTLYQPLQQGVLHLELFIHFSTMLIFRPRKRFTTLASVRLTGLRRRCSLLSEKWGELLHILNLILMDSWTFITHLVHKYSKDTKSFIKCFYQPTLYFKLWGLDPPRVHWDDPNRPSQFLWLSWRCWLARYKLSNLWSILKFWPSELLQAFHDIIEGQIDGKLLEIFHNKPKTALEIVPVRISNLYLIFINCQETS